MARYWPVQATIRPVAADQKPAPAPTRNDDSVAPGDGPSRRALLAAAALIAVACIGVYANSLGHPMLFDDYPSIVENKTIRSLWPPWPVLVPPVKMSVTGRPLINLTLAVNYALGGLDVLGYRLLNLLAHLLAALTLFGQTLSFSLLAHAAAYTVISVLVLILILVFLLKYRGRGENLLFDLSLVYYLFAPLAMLYLLRPEVVRFENRSSSQFHSSLC